MKTLYLTDSSENIYIDQETDEVGRLWPEDRYEIRSVYYIEEPMHVIYQCGTKKEELDAKKGDILLVFYNSRYNKYCIDTIHTKQWAANIKNRRKMEQQEKEEWAAKNAEPNVCCDCEQCGSTPVDSNIAPQPEEKSIGKLKKLLKKVKASKKS